MQIKLDSRLMAAAELVLPDKPAADIGTDHSYLPVYLVVNGICPRVIATDKSRGSFQKAQQLVELLSLEHQIDVRLGDGLEPLQPQEAATIIISGMGGHLIKDILAASPHITAGCRRLVLQPQKHIAMLRQWLAANDWRIVAEQIAFDNGFYYELLAAEHGQMTLSEDEAVFGPLLLRDPHPLFGQYLRAKLADLHTLIEQLQEAPSTDAKQRLQTLQVLTDKIERILREEVNDEVKKC
ncbi:MAG: class I SAM-dependent methyltransferase [Bacillota bacterium]|nr:class I SAM-dependent methyltransferase [Bacillota bacterium]